MFSLLRTLTLGGDPAPELESRCSRLGGFRGQSDFAIASSNGTLSSEDEPQRVVGFRGVVDTQIGFAFVLRDCGEE